MIENLRKYSGLTIVILVTIFISFFFLDSNALSNMGGGGTPVLKINGRNYRDKELNRLGKGAFELTSGLAQAGDFGLYQFLMSLTGNALTQEQAVEKFFVGRMLLREAQEEFGIYPSQQEISDYLRSLRAFAGPDGEFNDTQYRNFIEKGIGRLGLTEHDLRELANDILVSRKLNAILGAGLTTDRTTVAQTLALENQQITAEIAQLDLTPYRDALHPTDEELKAYWETIQDAFTTEPLRKFSYIVATPAAVAADEPSEAPEETPAPDQTDEEKAAAAQKKAEEEAAKTAAKAEERRKNQLELDSKVDDFLYELEQQKGAGFETLAANNGWEVKTTEFFALGEAPEDLNLAQRASSGGGRAVDALFRIQPSSDPFSKISDAIPVGENQWIVARLDGEEPSRVKTFEEAEEEVRAQYLSEKASEALKAAAEEAAGKIKEALAAGKSFADAAQEAGIETTHAVGPFTRTHQVDPAVEPANLFEATRNVDPGTLAEVILQADRAFLVYVAKRELVKAPDAETRIDQEVAARADENETVAFLAWLNARTDAAQVQQLNRR